MQGVKDCLRITKLVLVDNPDSGLGDTNQIPLFRGFRINSRFSECKIQIPFL